MKDKEKNFKLEIPLDASGIEGFKPEQGVRVAIKSRDGSINEQTIKLDTKGKGEATFTFSQAPGALQVVTGPDTASAEELFRMQTIGFILAANQWKERKELILPPIRISAYYWYWWLRWCRFFTIRGRVVCPDGSPVPGAKVCAYDVDMWWWWCSKQQVGCGTTDATGSFEIKFRWCCGWLPWWWWMQRVWNLEPTLAERIMPVLQRDLKMRQFPLPTPKPDLSIFEGLFAEQGRSPAATMATQATNAMLREGKEPMRSAIDAVALEKLRVLLMEKIPILPEFERLQIWPWRAWHPWWDCTPDIIFQVTQNCLGTEKVIVKESCWDTRWDIPSLLNVTLVTTKGACCINDPPPPEGNCMVITQACYDQVNNIGGNPGAAPSPEGYLNPGQIANTGDRPFAGIVPISGLFGDNAGVDYYEFEWSDDGGVNWHDMPLAAAGGFTRWYWGPVLPAGPVDFHPVPFPVQNIGGRNVIESREHFEDANDPASWGLTRFWTSNRDLMMQWLTENNFADGTYLLRVRSWNLVGGVLNNSRILPLCDTNEDNSIVLNIDNRIVGAASGHPTTLDHPCGVGTVHTCTTEPDTDIIAVKIIRKKLNGTETETTVGACGNIPITKSEEDIQVYLQVDFMANDPQGHLAYYTLVATYGENLMVDLLNLAGATLTPLNGAPVLPAEQVGPTYAAARSVPLPGVSAVAPFWRGGAIRLRVPAHLAFPVTCCYQLELFAHKRTIVNCDHSLWGHTNLSEYSFMIVV